MNSKIKALIARYDLELQKVDIEVLEIRDRVSSPEDPYPLNHARWMINQMLDNPEVFESNIPKTNRWLGFIQAILWMEDVRGILKLREESTGIDN